MASRHTTHKPRQGARRGAAGGRGSGRREAIPAASIGGAVELPGTELRVCTLGEAEIDLLELILHGHSNAEIAGQLGMSSATLDARVREIFRRFGVAQHLEALPPSDDLSAARADAEPRAREAGAFSLPPRYLRGV